MTEIMDFWHAETSVSAELLEFIARKLQEFAVLKNHQNV